MGRPLHIAPPHFVSRLILSPAAGAVLVILTVLMSAITVLNYLCGARRPDVNWRVKEQKHRTAILGEIRPIVERLKSGLKTKMIPWRKVVQDEEQIEAPQILEVEDEDGESDAVWKKAIMRGERCRPLDFSGKILYDCDGNLLPAQPDSPSKKGLYLHRSSE